VMVLEGEMGWHRFKEGKGVGWVWEWKGGNAGGDLAAGGARRRRDLWLATMIWQRREMKPVWARAGPSGLHRPIGQLGRFSRVGRREEMGWLQGLKKGKRDGLPRKVGPNLDGSRKEN
jgi:hypothetical protein